MKSISRLVAPLFAVSMFVNAVFADVSIENYQRSGGFKGFGAYEGHIVERIQDNKAHAERSIKYQNALMRMVGSGDKNEIIRIDLDKIWDLNVKKKTYSERAVKLPTPSEKTEKPSAPGKPSAEKDEKPTHRLKRAEFNVKKTGEKKIINGFNTEHYLANAIIEVEEIASQEVTTMLLDTNIWTTPWTKTLRQASQEQAAFAKAYLEKLGLPITADKNKRFDESSVRMLLGVGGPKTEETLAGLRKKVESIDGFPVATETIWTMKEDPKAVARREQEKSAAKANESDNEPGLDLSGGAAGAASGLLGGFAKKKMKERQEKAEAKRAGEPLLSTYYEVKSVSVDKLGADIFEVPSGFKKVGK